MGVILIKKRLFFFNQDNAHFVCVILIIKKIGVTRTRRNQLRLILITPIFVIIRITQKKMGIILLKKMGIILLKKKWALSC